MSFSPGQSIGSYRVLSRIGRGGMGVVYAAEHSASGQRVAIKVLHPELSRNREIVVRFFNEARAADQIGSEHIVKILEFGETENRDQYIIMEFIAGRTIVGALDDGPLDVQRALHIGAQVAAALGMTHDQSIIHRDLKPDNVMLTDRGGDPDFAVVLDFGLAKVLSAGGDELTAQGVVLGTPQYLAPEACEARPVVDRRVDIYALGVLLFEMTTAQLPFVGDGSGEIMVKQVTQEPPSPRQINPRISPSVERIILRCLSKRPEDRFQTMQELEVALRDPEGYVAGRGQRPTERPPGTRVRSVPARAEELPSHAQNRRGRLLAVGGLAVIAVGTSLYLGWGQTRRAPRRTPAPAAAAAPALARVGVSTVPSGAEVFDDVGNKLGETPLELEFAADGELRTLVFRHPHARERTKTFRVAGPMTLDIELPQE